MCAYLNFQLASVFTSDGCNFIFRRMMVGGGERKLAQYDPYDPEYSDDEEYEVSLLEILILHLVPLTWCI